MSKVIQLSARRTDPEAALWRWLRPQLTPYGAVSRVENPLDPGMPDVSYCLKTTRPGSIDKRDRITEYCEGWIELKAADTVADLRRKIKPTQGPWWLNRCAAGGAVWVLIRLEKPREHWLWRAPYAAQRLKLDGRETWFMNAHQLQPGESIAEALRW